MTLVYLAAAWVAGIALARAFHPPWQFLVFLGAASILGLLLWWDTRQVRLVAYSILMVALGAGRLLLAVPHFDDRSLSTYNDSGRVTLQGMVVGEPDERDRHTNLRVRAERLTLPDGIEQEVTGLALVQAGRYPRRAYGDRLEISGLLQSPPVYEGFSYRDYLARQGVYSFMRHAQIDALLQDGPKPLMAYLFALKRRAQAVIGRMLPEPEAALLTGILLGVESGIPEETMDDFEATGTSHIIVISGFNLTIVAGVFAGIAARFLQRRRALLVAMAAVAVYTILVGASPAVVRAAWMGILYLLGRYLGRETYAPVSLAAACLFMTAWNPNWLWDRGFLLSFAATAGLLFYTRPLEGVLERFLGRITSSERARKIVGLVSDASLVTIAAQLTTTPLLLAFFGRLSPVSLLSNVAILPAQSYIMTIGGAATLLGLIAPPLGRVVGWVVWLFLAYTVEVVRLTAMLPWASLSTEVDGWILWAYYGCLGLGTWWLGQPKDRRRELWSRLREWLRGHVAAKWLFGASGVLLALAVLAWRELPDGRLHVHFLDVGQGDAIFIETPSGRQVLIDGGPSPSLLLARLGRRMPFWDRTLDLVLLTHPDEDHITGLIDVLERYEVEAVIVREVGCRNPICQRWQELIEEAGVTVYRGEAGMNVGLDEGLQMDILHPGAELLLADGYNENSLVVRVSYGQASLLLAGDIEARAEGVLVRDGARLTSTVLKVAHHGGCTSTTGPFLAAVDPDLVVISVGEENDFGHPCQEVVDRLELSLGGDAPIYRTDQHGTIEVVSDGVTVWVETERSQ